MPDEIMDDSDAELGSRAFQPLLPPDHPAFEEAMALDVFDMVVDRQMHSKHHHPTCFKYGKCNKCRFRFPRMLVSHSIFDEATGVILQQRDHEWLNNYNPWFSLAMRTNHDCQYLFTQIHALAIIYYTMKYISKAEDNTHSKLTIAAAVAKALRTSNNNGQDLGKSMLIKTYNKLSSHREVGLPEIISHLLDYEDVVTGAKFENIYTTHLLNHLKAYNNEKDGLIPTDLGDSSIIRTRNTDSIVALFDDYAHRGSSLADMCLYDYCSLVYKSDDAGGIPFDEGHPLQKSYRQFVRKDGAFIPTLLGRLLFLRPDSEDESVRSDYFCLLSGLFLPWSRQQPPVKPVANSWEEFYSTKRNILSPRILRYIDNLSLLHKSKEEAQIDQLQLQAQYGQSTAADGSFDEYFDLLGGDHDQDEIDNEVSRTLAVVQSSLESSLESMDEYVREAMEANFDNGYFQDALPVPSSPDAPNFESIDPSDGIRFETVDPKAVRKLLKDIQLLDDNALQDLPAADVEPHVYLTDSDTGIDSVIHEFSLNPKQTRAFWIICNHALGHYPGPPQDDPQLLMGVFGAGGTGKSTLIEAIRTWFRRNHREKELIVTATTGSAAVKVAGTTVHSAVSIPIETNDGKKIGKLKAKQIEALQPVQYMIIDEVSMLDCKVMESLHTQLTKAKSKPEISFGGVNIIFFGDFLQLPAVVNPDLYIDQHEWGLGHRLWKSLNAVVMLTQPMRQARDPEYADLLSRVRMRVPTDEDIKTLKNRIGVKLPNMDSVAVTVRRHALRQAINMRRLREEEAKSNTPIVYCVGKVTKLKNINLHEAHQIQFGYRKSPVDAIIPVLPGVPLMITKNINKTLGMSILPYLTNTGIDLVNGKIVNLYGFADSLGKEPRGQIMSEPPAFMLVKVPGKTFEIGGFPPGVFPMPTVSLTFRRSKRKATFNQFPVTLAYAITDYKCQGETYYDGLLTDLRKPLTGSTAAASLYVQLSRVQSLQQLSIMRDFDAAELRIPLSKDLIGELEWEEQMDKVTAQKYSYME
jgi:ATP-dependent DNA helicase PIF1